MQIRTKSTCSYSGCSRPVFFGAELSSTLCLFHAQEKPARLFRIALARQIWEWRKSRIKIWDFGGFAFVDREKMLNLFCCAIFPVAADFRSARFNSFANFTNAQFNGLAEFRRVNFFRNAEFRDVQFWRNADFGSAQFNGYALFEGARFNGDGYFRNAKFDRDVDFGRAQFSHSAYFRSAQFDRNAGFGGAQFKGRAYFRSTQFSGNAYFESAQFAQDIHFHHVSFTGLCQFTHCTFHGTVKLRWPGNGYIIREGRTIPPGTLLIRKATIEGRTESDGTVIPGCLDLRDNALNKDSLLILREIDCMQRVLIAETDATRIQFERCTFGNLEDPFFLKRWKWTQLKLSRQVVADELDLREAKSEDPAEFEKVEQLYQRLTKRFRDDFNHQLANEFERGGFEMRRLAAHHRLGFRNWANYILLSLYKYTSYYSGSLLLPVFWLAVATGFVFAPLYDLTLNQRDLNLTPGAHFLPSLSALTAALRVAGLDRGWLRVAADGLPKGDQFIVAAIAVVQLIVTASLIALFILALRRRFKHGE
jgi:hypothetical protein